MLRGFGTLASRSKSGQFGTFAAGDILMQEIV